MTAEESLLGIDIGTSATKAVLARPDGSVIAQAERPHRLSLPRPGWVEHDAETTWWSDVVDVCAELAPVAAGGLQGICVSGIGPCVLLCDDRTNPLRPALLYGIDTRAEAEVRELEERLGRADILDRGGSVLSSQAAGPKLLWLSRNEPEVWQRAARWYMASSFVVARLTGAYVLDHHSASQSDPLYDLEAGGWADDWAAEVAPGLRLPELVWPSDQVGSVTDAAAHATGLPQGTPVVAGTIDAWAEAFSAGVRRPGELMLMYGSSMFGIRVVEGATREPLLWTTEGTERGTRTLAAGMSTAGSLTAWARELAGAPSWDELIAEAAAVPPGSDGLLLLPYFAGERTPIYDPHARGVLAGLTLKHARGALLRSVYEGIAFGTRQMLELFEGAAGAPGRIVAVGGGTRSPLWLQIVSDVSGRSQLVPELAVGASYGDALLAAIGVGLVPVETDWARTTATVTPNEGDSATYEQLFELYGRLYRDTADVVHALGSPPAQD
jgi:xylulokinase